MKKGYWSWWWSKYKDAVSFCMVILVIFGVVVSGLLCVIFLPDWLSISICVVGLIILFGWLGLDSWKEYKESINL